MRIAKSKRLTTQANNQLKITKFRMSQLMQSQVQSIIQSKNTLPFNDRKNRIIQFPSKNTIKISTKRTAAISSRNIKQMSTILNLNRSLKTQSIEYAKLILLQIQKNKRYKQKTPSQLCQIFNEIFSISQKMNEEIYSYKNIEKQMIKLHEILTILGSRTLLYRSFSFSAFTLYQYCSYSLSLYYFDRALKSFYDRPNNTYHQLQKYHEIQLYKYICKIFLVKQKYQQAKKFALKFLRKCWILKNIDEQMMAYDLLGKIYMQLQDINMSRYFHNRMSCGQSQNLQIMQMSKHNMNKQIIEKSNFVCYQTINIFVERDSQFNDILENHYKMRSLEYSKEKKVIVNQVNQIYIYTHHSPNRLLNNYHILQRKMIEARQSKEIHFIKPKDCARLRRLFAQYSSLIHDLKQKFHHKTLTEEFNLAIQHTIII